MITFPILSEWLKNGRTGLLSGEPDNIRLTGELFLLDPLSDEDLADGALYLADSSAFPPFLSHLPYRDEEESAFPAVLFCGSPVPAEVPEALPKELSVLFTELSLTEAFNLLSRESYLFDKWQERLDVSIYKSHDLQSLLDIAGEVIPGTCTLTDSSFKLMAGFYSEKVTDPVVEELREKGVTSYETIQSLRNQKYLVSDSVHVEYVSSVGNYTIAYLIRYQNQVTARLSLCLPDAGQNPYAASLFRILYEKVTRYLFSKRGLSYHANTALGAFAADLIEGRITDEEEIKERLQRLHQPAWKYFHIMLISFDTEGHQNLPWNYILGQLAYVFPYADITTYKGDVFLIIKKEHRSNKLRYDEEKLLTILTRHNGTAAIGNAGMHFAAVPTMYHQVKDTLRIGHRIDPAKRILFYEDYAMYQIIEFAEIGSRETSGSTNLVHLCNNELVALLIYDERNNTNLLEILHTYLLNERNASQTAKDLYLHRNTVIYKIKQIEEILDESLDSPVLRERLLFGCTVLSYMKKYRNQDLLKLNRNISPAKGKNDN